MRAASILVSILVSILALILASHRVSPTTIPMTWRNDATRANDVTTTGPD